jgi:hypothetical protein
LLLGETGAQSGLADQRSTETGHGRSIYTMCTGLAISLRVI